MIQARETTRRIEYKTTFDWGSDKDVLHITQNGKPAIFTIYGMPAPRVAIIREEGSNGDREMAAAFTLAGFQVPYSNCDIILQLDGRCDDDGHVGRTQARRLLRCRIRRRILICRCPWLCKRHVRISLWTNLFQAGQPLSHSTKRSPRSSRGSAAGETPSPSECATAAS